MKITSILAAVAAALALSACGQSFSDSPEQKQFHAFLEHCKQVPTDQACIDFKKTGEQ